MNLEKLLLIVGAFKQAEIDARSQESWQSAGSHYLRERLTVIAERCCRDWPGDLIEIGCLRGGTTQYLCQVAKEHGRRVIAVDPWASGTQNCEGGEYESFCKTIAPWLNLVDVVRKDSRSPEVVEFIKGRELAMAFIDGLHEHDACVSDIRTCYHAPLLVCDDWAWNPGIEQAIIETTGARQRFMEMPFHECYLL